MERAKDLLRDTLEWRSREDIDSLASWTPPERLARMYPTTFAGFDAAGNPVWVVPFGEVDVTGKRTITFLHIPVCVFGLNINLKRRTVE